ncbi:MAG: hypothetical protein LCH41_14580 [Armatimonadetes bacterium]|nr:hypothetical protein [Armatimonadota bacterium]
MKLFWGNDIRLGQPDRLDMLSENQEIQARSMPATSFEQYPASESLVQMVDEERRKTARRVGIDLIRGLAFGTFVSGCALLPARHLEDAPGWLHPVAQLLVGADWVERAGPQQYALMIVGCLLGWVCRFSSFRGFLMQAGAVLLGAQLAAVFWAEIVGLRPFMDVIDFPALYALSVVIGLSAAWGILYVSFREVLSWLRSLKVD